MTPAASWSRMATFDAAVLPLLPTTNVYVRPPRHTGAASRPMAGMSPAAGGTPPSRSRWSADGFAVVGHDRAQTGSGESAFVIVRSIAGRTVVEVDDDAW